MGEARALPRRAGGARIAALPTAWTAERAEAYLRALEPIGWKLGLERMRMLTAALGMPQNRFASIHVVGTNGKSSVTRMTAALLEAHGVASGACLSPHLQRWSERVLVGGEEIGAGEFASSVERTAQAAEVVDRALEEGDRVTQFEVATAAAFVALAAARVEVGVVEAGLGGRLDASNVLASRITVLTSIGLDHTQWLGETETEIAAEKLAVLRDQSCLVVGAVGAEVLALAEEAARQRGARLVRAGEDPGEGIELRAPGQFQRRNFAIACTAAAELLGGLDERRVGEVAAAVTVPGRLEWLAGKPPTLLDAAHNAEGAGALAEALPALAAGRPLVACLALLADKDAAAIVGALAPAIDEAVCTELPVEALAGSGRPGARFWPPAELAGHCARAGVAATSVADAKQAVAAARARASELGGVALIAGSHYLVAAARGELG